MRIAAAEVFGSAAPPLERLRVVLEAAAGCFSWGRRRPVAGTGVGLACGTEKGGYMASCVEVSVERGGGLVRVPHVVSAFECGAMLNPDHLTSQIEGCTGWSASASTKWFFGRKTEPLYASSAAVGTCDDIRTGLAARVACVVLPGAWKVAMASGPCRATWLPVE